MLGDCGFCHIAKVCSSGHILLPIFVSGTSHQSFWNTSITSCPFNDFHPRFSDYRLHQVQGKKAWASRTGCIVNRLHSEMVSSSDISCEMEICSSNEFVEQVYADIAARGERKVGSAANDS
jgi:hypothetical protein